MQSCLSVVSEYMGMLTFEDRLKHDHVTNFGRVCYKTLDAH